MKKRENRLGRFWNKSSRIKEKEREKKDEYDYMGQQ